MMTNRELVAPPSHEPLTLSEAKTVLRIKPSDTSLDTDIQHAIEAARDEVERYTNISLIDQAWKIRLTAFQTTIDLPSAPVHTIHHIKYYDTSDEQQTITSTEYALDQYSPIQSIYRVDNTTTWPTTSTTMRYPIEVQYVAGFGASKDVPELIKRCMHLIIKHWIDHTDEAALGLGIRALPMQVYHLLNRYRMYSIV